MRAHILRTPSPLAAASRHQLEKLPPILCLGFSLTAAASLGAAGEADAPVAAQWTVHAQSTFIDQAQPGFSADYSGANSLDNDGENAHTVTATIFLGRALWPGAGLYLDPELTQGNGLSGTTGIAGFPEGEATHAGGTEAQVSTARFFLRQTFGFGGGSEAIEDDQNQLAGKQDVDRLTVTLGKFAAADIFDGNAYSHDPRTQFLNWSLMDDTAWDYPANAKGYTGGAAVEWNRRTWTLRWAIMMEPAEANGPALDPHVAKFHGQVLEWERRYELGGRSGTVRPMVYWNRADMGGYAEALQEPAPSVISTRSQRSKAGAGLSWDQELTADLGAFARFGWNDGKAESWAFTEVDQAESAGLSWKPAAWGRSQDTLGAALAVDGLSGLHRSYLAAGGYGFIVGDGRLNYSTEDLAEVYYAWRPAPWLALTPDYQFVLHPGYNRDRGPVSVFALRVHLEF
jgi:high affinity Mn2+ porin